MFGKVNLKIIESALLGAVLGAIFPISGFLAGWWGTFAVLPAWMSILIALIGFSTGILVDIVYLRRWINRAYSYHWIIWIAVYLFYATSLFGFFMGVPVFHLFLSIPTGIWMGSKLARQFADEAERKRAIRNTCLFTTGVLAAICLASAVIAWVDPYTGGNLQGMLGLPFEVTRGIIAGIIAIGGTALLILNWVSTQKVIELVYALRMKDQLQGEQAVKYVLK